MPVMRAKLQVTGVEQGEGQLDLTMVAVGGDSVQGGYPEDGADEDNSYSRWTPSADLRICIQNPALYGKFEVGQKFYVDFSGAE